jgi:hypothetical protein
MPLRPRWAPGCSARRPSPTTAPPAPAYGRIPRPSQTGNCLRRAARPLFIAASASGDPAYAQIVLITRLTTLAEAIADLRQAQRHAAQAAAVRRTAERLHAARYSAAFGCSQQLDMAA